LKVLHVSPTFFDPASVMGGGERYAMCLARAETALPGAAITFLSFGAEASEYRDGDLRVRILRPEFLGDGDPMNPISWSILTPILEHDLVHVHQQNTRLAQMVVMLAKALGKPVCVTDLGGGARPLGEISPLDRWVDAYLCVSEFSARRITARPGQVHVVSGGTDFERFFRPAEARRDGYCLFVGRVLPHKGIDYLIEGARTLPVKIVGTTPDRTYLGDLRRLAAGKPIEFIGRASDDDLRQLYAGALATVLPSVYTDMYGRVHDNPELFGLVLVESMACATPVICTSVGSLPELVIHGETGLIVPPNDPSALREAMQRFADDPGLAEAMGRRALEVAKSRFTWQAVAERCWEAYGRALGGPTP
jgi:glycosyltransferase involved in cell wall biosynthesis